MDIVKRLREGRSEGTELTWNPTKTHYEAADEITRLRAELAEARTEIARLRAEREWMPIETAPRDGTRILTYDDAFRHAVTWWSKSHDTWRDEDCHWQEGDEPAHWQPLPPSPEANP